MADQDLMIVGGPPRFKLMASVFDIEYPRLLKFLFKCEGERFGSADLLIDGAKQGNTKIEEWHLSGYFMPDGLETPLKNMIPVRLTYSSHLRSGIVFSVDQKTVTGRPAPNVIDLITWKES